MGQEPRSSSKRIRRTREIFERESGISIPEGYHLHHIDGDRSNNSLDNLLPVSPAMHLAFHREDWKVLGHPNSRPQTKEHVEKRVSSWRGKSIPKPCNPNSIRSNAKFLGVCINRTKKLLGL